MGNEITKASPLQTMLFQRKNALAMVLPKGMDADRVIRITLGSVLRTPALARCNPETIYMAMHRAAQLGLEPGGPLGHAYLVPFGDSAEFIIGYRGLIELARRSGMISRIYSEPVFTGDTFQQQLGLHRDIIHEPGPRQDVTYKAMTHCYAVIYLKGCADADFEVCTKAQIEAIKSHSRAANNGPWSHPYDAVEMARKSVLKRLLKRQPMSIEAAEAIERENELESGALKDANPITPTVNLTPLPLPQQPAPVIQEQPISEIQEAEEIPAAQNESAPPLSSAPATATVPTAPAPPVNPTPPPSATQPAPITASAAAIPAAAPAAVPKKRGRPNKEEAGLLPPATQDQPAPAVATPAPDTPPAKPAPDPRKQNREIITGIYAHWSGHKWMTDLNRTMADMRAGAVQCLKELTDTERAAVLARSADETTTPPLPALTADSDIENATQRQLQLVIYFANFCVKNTQPQ